MIGGRRLPYDTVRGIMPRPKLALARNKTEVFVSITSQIQIERFSDPPCNTILHHARSRES
jgi:hypothetical protein